MDKKNELVVDAGRHSEDPGKEVETFELLGKKGLCDQLIDKIMSMSSEVRTQFDYSIAVQGAGVKIPRSGLGDIEVTPPKVLLKISPKSN